MPPDDDDNDLENAIGEAFKSISDIKGKDRKQEEQVNDDELNAMIAQSFQKAVEYRNQILILIMMTWKMQSLRHSKRQWLALAPHHKCLPEKL